jgi:hypothetical protein
MKFEYLYHLIDYSSYFQSGIFVRFTESRTTYIFDRGVFLLGCELGISKVLFFLSYDQKFNVKLYLLIGNEMKTKPHFLTNRPHFIANFVGNAVA